MERESDGEMTTGISQEVRFSVQRAAEEGVET